MSQGIIVPDPQSSKLASGVPGLDDVLSGGWPAGKVYLVEGSPGTGKTTLSLQFLLAGLEAGETGLYISLSESRAELEVVAASHGWSLDRLEIFEVFSDEGLNPDQEQTVLHPAELELGETIRAVMAQVDAVRPKRLAFDSLSDMRLLAQSSLRYRRQVLALKHFLMQRNCTALLLADRTADGGDLQLHSVASGVLVLEQVMLEYGAQRRRLRLMKLRGTAFRGGWHDYTIQRGGLVSFPRLPIDHHRTELVSEALSSGAPGLDALLGGGLVPGTNILLIGPSGTGKTSLATSVVIAALRRGERAAYFLSDERLPTLLTRSANFGMDLRPYIQSGMLTVRHIDAAEVSPGQFAAFIREQAERDGCRVVAIDSLNAYLRSLPGEKYLTLRMNGLLSFLHHHRVITLMVVTQEGAGGAVRSNVDLSHLADSVVRMRFFEVEGVVRRAISVLKSRIAASEPTIREFTFGAAGLEVGPPLRGFRGVLTGSLDWSGAADDLMPLNPATPAFGGSGGGR